MNKDTNESSDSQAWNVVSLTWINKLKHEEINDHNNEDNYEFLFDQIVKSRTRMCKHDHSWFFNVILTFFKNAMYGYAIKLSLGMKLILNNKFILFDYL